MKNLLYKNFSYLYYVFINFLNDDERAHLKAQHKKERDKRICDRIQAVLLYDEGWTLQLIAKALLLSEDAIRQHINDYKKSKKLKPESGGSKEKLSQEKSKLLEEHLQSHTYHFVKDIVSFVQSKWKISYTIPGMLSWLKRHGFSYKKPVLVHGKANEEQQNAWLTEYEKLKEDLSKDETICFMDGVHPTHNFQTAYGWFKKGVRKEIPANTGRSRLNISGIIDVISHKLLINEDKALNAEATINFFKRTEKAYPEKMKIHIFCDNARYYKNRDVREYLKSSKIELHFLPPYSPNLNPIERLWKWMKERIIYNAYYEEFQEFKSAVFGFFAMLSSCDPKSELGQLFRRRVRDKFKVFGAPSTDF